MDSEYPNPARRHRRHDPWLLLLAALATTAPTAGSACSSRSRAGAGDTSSVSDGSSPSAPSAGTTADPSSAAGTAAATRAPSNDPPPSTSPPFPPADAAPYPAPSADDRPDAAVTPPRLAAGWVAADAPRLYLPDDLQLLVAGGAGVFLQYGFAWAARRSYRAEREVSRMVRVEVYAFSSPDGARGRYDHDGRPTGQVWSAEPPPPELAGKVDAARVDLDQARLLRGRYYAVLQYEDAVETDLANLIEAASPVLLGFANALADGPFNP